MLYKYEIQNRYTCIQISQIFITFLARLHTARLDTYANTTCMHHLDDHSKQFNFGLTQCWIIHAFHCITQINDVLMQKFQGLDWATKHTFIEDKSQNKT